MEVDMKLSPDSDSNIAQEAAKDHTTDVSYTPADRIAELNNIDKSIAALLAAASTATSILSNPNDDTAPTNLDEAEQKFTEASSLYFSILSSIEVRLRRQVYALEEAGLVAAGNERDARRGRNLHGDAGADLTRRGTGGGPLDSSWLNARASKSVEQGKEAELLQQGRALFEEIQRREDAGSQMDTDTV